MLKLIFTVLVSRDISLESLTLHYLSIEFLTHESFMAYWEWSKEAKVWNAPITSNVLNMVDFLFLHAIQMPREADEEEVASSTNDGSDSRSTSSDDDEDTESTLSEWDAKEEGLAQFILAFCNLEGLTLSFARVYCSPLVLERLSSSEKPWSRLATLNLVNMQTTQHDLLRLLETQKESLRNFDMLGLALVDGHWVSILHALGIVLMLEYTGYDFLTELQTNFIWRKKGPGTEGCLRSRLKRFIIQKDETFHCPL